MDKFRLNTGHIKNIIIILVIVFQIYITFITIPKYLDPSIAMLNSSGVSCDLTKDVKACSAESRRNILVWYIIWTVIALGTNIVLICLNKQKESDWSPD